jgi:G3E family GTPase
MNLLLMAGFLGSGKTTLVIRLAKVVAQRNLRSAVLVNEIGEVGIDDQLMRQLDLNVWELMGGCICCTLTSGLLTDLHRLDQEYDPDLVILEATGAAQPSEVIGSLRYYQGRPLRSVTTAVTVDPLRLPKLVRVIGPLIQAQVAAADILLLTKTDLASGEEIAGAQRIVREINPTAPLLHTSASEGLKPEMLQGVLPWLN